MASNVETVKGFYTMFGTGDVQGIVEACDDSVVFNYRPSSVSDDPNLPFLHQLAGKEGVAKFFEGLSGSLQHTKFEVKAVAGDGPNVLALVDEAGVSKTTGKEVDLLSVHQWEFNADGKLIKWQAFLDSKALAVAFAA